MLGKYTAEIVRFTRALHATINVVHKPMRGFMDMEILETHYSEKKAMGTAVINACTAVQGTNSSPMGSTVAFPWIYSTMTSRRRPIRERCVTDIMLISVAASTVWIIWWIVWKGIGRMVRIENIAGFGSEGY